MNKNNFSRECFCFDLKTIRHLNKCPLKYIEHKTKKYVYIIEKIMVFWIKPLQTMFQHFSTRLTI